MQTSNQDYRHASLMAAIIAVVPLIFYPGSLGLNFKISLFPFLLLEVAYYWVIFGIFLRGASFGNVLVSGIIGLVGRIAIGVVFAFLLMAMHATGLGEAFAAGIYKYKPAMFLQVVSFPFILMPLLKGYMPEKSRKKARVVIQTADKIAHDQAKENEKPRTIIGAPDYKDRKIIGVKTAAAEKPYTGFDEALKYVGELSAVRFAILIDSKGLPVSFYGENLSLRNLWSAIGIYAAEKIREALKRAGEFDLEAFELMLDVYRLHMVQVEELYLFVAADKESGETEKVRVAQAANMIRKIYQERYSIKPDVNAREESYVPSFS